MAACLSATALLSGTPIAMRTPAGSMKFYLGGADSLVLARAKGRSAGTDWFGEVIELVKIETVADLELPDGNTSVTDLSDGVPNKLETLKNKDGKQSVKIAMSPWSLKTLEIK